MRSISVKFNPEKNVSKSVYVRNGESIMNMRKIKGGGNVESLRCILQCMGGSHYEFDWENKNNVYPKVEISDYDEIWFNYKCAEECSLELTIK
jgi:hypothetical protein